MSKVVFDISVSVDGFMTGAHVRPAAPAGDGMEQLHEWAMDSDDGRDAEVLHKSRTTAGAMICGRRTYEMSLPWWETDGPSGVARLPVFVVTHSEPPSSPRGGVYTFVTDGIESALRRAQAVAGDLDVQVMGGADIGQQYLRAGLVDELSLHVAPVVMGSGTRLFENLDNQRFQLEAKEVVLTAAAAHIRYRILERASS